MLATKREFVVKNYFISWFQKQTTKRSWSWIRFVVPFVIYPSEHTYISIVMNIWSITMGSIWITATLFVSFSLPATKSRLIHWLTVSSIWLHPDCYEKWRGPAASNCMKLSNLDLHLLRLESRRRKRNIKAILGLNDKICNSPEWPQDYSWSQLCAKDFSLRLDLGHWWVHCAP